MFKFVPAYIIDYSTLANGLHDPDPFMEEIEFTRKALKRVADYQWDSQTIRFSNIYGTEFKFQIHKSTHLKTKVVTYDFYMWDVSGQVAIYGEQYRQENVDTIIKKIGDHAEKWSRGEIRCSGCGDWCVYSDIRSNNFYAGHYCLKCWNGGMKKRAEEENYN